MTAAQVRSFAAGARSTDTIGRVLCSIRNHHFIIDGPAQNGFPGEEVTPAEMFLAAIASCGVELLQGLARDGGTPLTAVRCDISGNLDRSKPVRSDVSVFNAVKLDFHLSGVSKEQGVALVERFRGR